jgi:hypothetical protein
MSRLTRNRQSSWQCVGCLQANMLLHAQRVNAGTGVSFQLDKQVNFASSNVWTVCLEHLYYQRGLLVRRYPARGEIMSYFIWLN